MQAISSEAQVTNKALGPGAGFFMSGRSNTYIDHLHYIGHLYIEHLLRANILPIRARDPSQKPYLGVKKQPQALKRSQPADAEGVLSSPNPYGVWLQKKL